MIKRVWWDGKWWAQVKPLPNRVSWWNFWFNYSDFPFSTLFHRVRMANVQSLRFWRFELITWVPYKPSVARQLHPECFVEVIDA